MLIHEFCLVSWTALCWTVRTITFSLDEFDLSYGIKNGGKCIPSVVQYSSALPAEKALQRF